MLQWYNYFEDIPVLFILVNLLTISLYKVYRVDPFKENRVTLSSVKYLGFQSNYRSRYFLSRATHRSGASAWTQCPALRIVVSIWFGNNNAIWSMCECRTNRDCPPLIINTSPYTSAWINGKLIRLRTCTTTTATNKNFIICSRRMIMMISKVNQNQQFAPVPLLLSILEFSIVCFYCQNLLRQKPEAQDPGFFVEEKDQFLV